MPLARVGWHCTACNRYFQRGTDETPDRCRYCDGATLKRIDHDGDAREEDAPSLGDDVAFETTGQTRAYVVGRVVDASADRLVIHAHDGTGLYTVALDHVVTVRS